MDPVVYVLESGTLALLWSLRLGLPAPQRAPSFLRDEFPGGPAVIPSHLGCWANKRVS